MSRGIYIFLSLIFFLPTTSFSQDPPIEWGEIPIEQLKMKEFPSDSNAAAVILCDYGESRFNNDLDLLFLRHLRIKILNENGYDAATHVINLYTEDDTERLSDIEATTYSLSPNEEIMETELDDDNIFEEEITDTRTEYKFTMPALSPGCIIDIKYEIVAKSIYFIRDWIFTTDEPVLWSEYRVTTPKNINYVFVNGGYLPYYLQENKEVSQTFMGSASAYLGNNIVECYQYRWIIKDAPAIRDEPYTTTMKDYQNFVQAQLSGYSFRGMGIKRVLNDWPTLTNELLDNNAFGEMIDITGDVEDLTDQIIIGLNTPEEKLNAIYNWVSQSIKWNGSNRVFADKDVDDVIEDKSGSSAEINFLLLSMLRYAGITCDPVILSTRSNGRLQELYPIVSQFNLVISRVKIGTKTFFIDATDPLRSIDLLPKKVLNVKALVLKEDKPEWVTISSPKPESNISVLNAELLADGSIKCNVEKSLGEYLSLSIRKDLKDKSEKEVAEELLDVDEIGLTIDSLEFKNIEEISKPIVIKAWFSSSNYAQLGGDLIYLNPLVLDRMKENPFKSEERRYPVDYAYLQNNTLVANINLPKDYELKEKFENLSFPLGNSVSYKRNVQADDGVVQIIYKMQIKKPNIKIREYKQLKTLYSRIISSDNEMLVLGRKTKTEESLSSENTQDSQ